MTNYDITKLNDISIVYYLVKKEKSVGATSARNIELLKNNDNKFVFKRYDIDEDDENVAVCCVCLKRLEIRTEEELNKVFDEYYDEIDKIIKSYNFTKLKLQYFKGVIKFRYEAFKSKCNEIKNKINLTDNNYNYVMFKCLPKRNNLNDKFLKYLNSNSYEDKIINAKCTTILKKYYVKNNINHYYYRYKDEILKFYNKNILYNYFYMYYCKYKNDKYKTVDIKLNECKYVILYSRCLNKYVLVDVSFIHKKYKLWIPKYENGVIYLYDEYDNYIKFEKMETYTCYIENYYYYKNRYNTIL